MMTASTAREDLRVPVIRRGDDDRFHSPVLQQAAVIDIHPRRAPRALAGPRSVLLVDVADRHYLHVAVPLEILLVHTAHAAAANYPDSQAVACRSRARRLDSQR